MPAGLQAWDAAGNLIYDVTTPVMKFLGVATIGYAATGSVAQSGSIYVPEFATYPNEKWVARTDGGFSNPESAAVVWVDGAYVYWQYPKADPGYLAIYNTYVNRPVQTFEWGLR